MLLLISEMCRSVVCFFLNYYESAGNCVRFLVYNEKIDNKYLEIYAVVACRYVKVASFFLFLFDLEKINWSVGIEYYIC